MSAIATAVSPVRADASGAGRTTTVRAAEDEHKPIKTSTAILVVMGAMTGLGVLAGAVFGGGVGAKDAVHATGALGRALGRSANIGRGAFEGAIAGGVLAFGVGTPLALAIGLIESDSQRRDAELSRPSR